MTSPTLSVQLKVAYCALSCTIDVGLVCARLSVFADYIITWFRNNKIDKKLSFLGLLHESIGYSLDY